MKVCWEGDWGGAVCGGMLVLALYMSPGVLGGGVGPGGEPQ